MSSDDLGMNDSDLPFVAHATRQLFSWGNSRRASNALPLGVTCSAQDVCHNTHLSTMMRMSTC